MSRIVGLFNILADGSLAFWCPGCQETHRVPVGEGPGPRWGFNGNHEAPTFTPSLLVRSGHFVPGHAPQDPCWCQPDADGTDWGFACKQCHSFITDGRIQFLDDCSHELRGQTVPMPPWPLADA